MLARLKEWMNTPRAKLLLVGGAILTVPAAAYAIDIIGTFWSIVAAIFEFGVKLMAFIMISLVKLLISVAQYQNFVAPGPTAVRIGWVVTRDLANMFFIFILLIIAFGTIVGYQKYNYRDHLPRLLLMAIVINFSKTICGIFIDMGQVIMLTFVNGFAQAAGGNFLNAFQINKLLQLKQSGQMDGQGLALGMALAFVMVSIATNVVLVMLIMLTFRIVFLWVLIILSPMAFLASAFPPAASYYGKWWDMFRKYIQSGPIVAFFLWLALISVQQAGTCQESNGTQGSGIACDGFINSGSAASAAEQAQQSTATGIPTQAAGDDAIMSLIIVTAILMAGLKIANELDAGSVGAANWIKGQARGLAMASGRLGLRTGVRATGIGFRAGGRIVTGLGNLSSRIPIVGTAFKTVGSVMKVQGNRLAPPGKPGAMRRAIGTAVRGSAEERAIASPAAFAASFAKEKDPKKLAEMTKAMEDEDVKKRLAGRGDIAQGLDNARKVNPAFDKNYNQYVRENWKSKDFTDEQRRDGFKAFGAEDGAKLTADDIRKNKGLVPAMGAGGFNQLLTHGTKEQESAMQEALNDKTTNPGGARKLLEKNKTDAAALSADTLEKVDGASAFALASGRKDTAKMDEMMNDEKKAVQLANAAGAAFAGTSSPSSDLTIDAIRTGAIDAGTIEADAQVNAKVGDSLNPPDMLKRLKNMDDPKQRAAGQAAWSAFEKANPERAKKLADTGAYNDFIKPKTPGGAGQTPPPTGTRGPGQPQGGAPGTPSGTSGGGQGAAASAAQGVAAINAAAQQVAQAGVNLAGTIRQAGQAAGQGITATGGSVAQKLEQAGSAIGAAGTVAAGNVETTGEEVSQSIGEAGQEFKEAGETAAGAVEKTGEDVGRAGQQAAKEIKRAADAAKKRPLF